LADTLSAPACQQFVKIRRGCVSGEDRPARLIQPEIHGLQHARQTPLVDAADERPKRVERGPGGILEIFAVR